MDIDKQTNYNRDILKNILYISVNLDYSSKQQLESFFNEHNIWQNKNIKLLCHHMTITFHTVLPYHILEYTYKNIGEDKDMKVVGYGVSEKAFAVLVETDVPSTNDKKHITCAVNLDNGGKPVDSNSIENWTMLSPEKRFNLKGAVTINYKK
jgi:hypothetical protein